MEIHGIGELLLNIREKRGISQKELAQGLCTQRELSKIESGEKYPDTFLLDALMSRLGKSTDKLEYTVSEEEYEYLVQRAEIEQVLENEQYEEVKNKIEEYEEVLGKGDEVHFQYIAMMKAFLALYEKENEEDYIKHLECAMDCTMPFWRKNTILNHRMTWLEIGLYLLWARKVKNKQEMVNVAESILEYIEKQWDDEEEKVKIYPFAAVLYCRELMGEKQYQRMDKISEKAIGLLTRNNSISNLLELLKIRIKALEGMKEAGIETCDLERLIKQKTALEMVEKEYEFVEREVAIFTRVKREIYLDREIIQRNRKAKGITQEELSEGICAQETLARIEQGRKAHNRNFEKLAERLSWTKKKLTNEIAAWDYSLLEKKQEIDWLMSRYRYKEAKEKLLEFPYLDTVEGKQFYLYKRAASEMELGEKSPEEALKLFEEALALTLQVENIEKLKEYVLTRQEVVILNGIARVYARIGKREIALLIYKNVLEGYEESIVLDLFKSRGMLLILGNYATYLEEMDCLDRSLEICLEEMNLEFKSRRVGEIATILGNIAYVYERQEIKIEEQKKLYWEAYYISDLLENKVLTEITEGFFSELYGGSISEYEVN